jgi:hypothetical protein
MSFEGKAWPDSSSGSNIESKPVVGVKIGEKRAGKKVWWSGASRVYRFMT